MSEVKAVQETTYSPRIQRKLRRVLERRLQFAELHALRWQRQLERARERGEHGEIAAAEALLRGAHQHAAQLSHQLSGPGLSSPEP